MTPLEPGNTGIHVEGEYRCSACGHGERLQACAEAIVAGMLEPNGDVTQDDVSQTVLCESSIECLDHPGSAPLERWFGGAWTRWRACEWKAPDDRAIKCENGTQMYLGRRIGTCPECKGAGGVNVPLEVVDASP